MLNQINIFKFASATEFLKVASEQFLSRKNRPFTMQEWSKRLNYRSHRSIGMVLNGERLPSRTMVKMLVLDLAMDSREERYFELLVTLERHKRTGKEVRPVIEQLEALNPVFVANMPLDAASFSYISEWYHLVLKQLITTPSFREDAHWLRERLRQKVSTAEIADAIAVLERLQMVEREDGKLVVAPKHRHLKTSSDLGEKAIKLHHRQMLQRASEAMDEQASAEREITSITLKFDRRRLPEAKEALRRFRDEFHHLFEVDQSDDVYQLNLQLFAHTSLEDKSHVS